MRTHQTMTISLPPEMLEEFERVRKAEQRTRSELVREALRTYMRMRALPAYTPTKAELRALARGRAAHARGDYYTHDEFNRLLLGPARQEARGEARTPRAPSRARAARPRAR